MKSISEDGWRAAVDIQNQALNVFSDLIKWVKFLVWVRMGLDKNECMSKHFVLKMTNLFQIQSKFTYEFLLLLIEIHFASYVNLHIRLTRTNSLRLTLVHM